MKEINMSEKVLNNYTDFVTAVTSEPSMDTETFIERLHELQSQDCNIARLLTGAVGITAEGGEFMEIVKKIMFQGKPWNEDNKFHLFRELGDIAFYFVTAAAALNVDPYAIIEENVRKLESRYPGGKFDVNNSEVRKEGDI